VLIADSLSERGARVAEACEQQGMAVHRVSHGAAALEYALAHKPVAMVVQHALPLIAGPRLADILESNPHTQNMGVLIVDDDAEEGQGDDRSRVLPGSADPETIARFLGALLLRRSQQPATEPAESAPTIEGNLAQLALGELIELFHVNRKSGIIEMREDGGRSAAQGEIHLESGDVVQARSGEFEGEKALFRLLRWRRGNFCFRENVPRAERGIERATRALLREGERQAKEWTRLAGDMPPEHARVALKVSRSSLPNLLHPVTQEVLLVLEFSDRVQDVVDRCSFPDYQVLRTLQTLLRRGLIELQAEAEGPKTPRAGLFTPAAAARVRDWLEQGRGRDGPAVDAKVPVWAANPEALGVFGERMARLPGVVPSPDGSSARLAPLLRVPVDTRVGIELLGVPCSPRSAPIWPLCAHGAMAALFLHAGPVEASVEALRPAIEAVSRRPRARVFHLLLEDKEPVAAETLCERLGLFDDRFVVRVPLERPDEAGPALRELLARLLP